jgi:hypothetical protein
VKAKFIKDFLKESIHTKLERIYDYFMKVNIDTLDKYKSIDQAFLSGYSGKSLSININTGSPLYMAWKAGKDRRSKKFV